jgi:hypothetical protein
MAIATNTYKRLRGQPPRRWHPRERLTEFSLSEERGMLSRQLFDPAVTSHADADRLLRTEPQVQLTPFVLNNHSNSFKSHLHFPLYCVRRCE